MADLFYVGAYWGPRAESAGECADRLADCMRSLGGAHPSLATWYRKGKSNSSASGQAVNADRGSLEALLASGRNRTDVGGEVINELGFRLSLWNKSAVAVSLSTTCGAAPPTPSVMNYFTLELPMPLGSATELYDREVAHRIFMSVISAWSPEWATFASYSMRAPQTVEPGHPIGGWLTFISGTPSCESSNPGLDIREVAGGVLLTAGPDALHVSDSQLSTVIDHLSRLD